MLRLAVVVFGFFVLFCHHTISQAQVTLPTVTVTGSYTGGTFDPGTGVSYGNAGAPSAAYIIVMQYAIQAQTAITAASSVRCAGLASKSETIRNTTSRDSHELRWAAAESVYRNIVQTTSAWDKFLNQLFGGTAAHAVGSSFVVLYADMGRETWQVISPTFSTATGGNNIVGSLVLGDGVIRPYGSCN